MSNTNPFLQSPLSALSEPNNDAPLSLPYQPTTDTRQPAAPKADNLLPPAPLRPLFESTATKYDVPVNVLMALGHQESRYNAAAVGPTTKWGRAKGMMQYLDSTAEGMGINQFDPAQSIDAAAKQIRERLDKGYSMDDAVKEHFAGPDRKLWGPKTEVYGREVMEKAGAIGGLFTASSPAQAEADPMTGLQAQLDKEEPGRYRVMSPQEVAAFEAEQAKPAEEDGSSWFDDMGKMLVGGAYKGIGSTMRGIGAVPQIIGEYTTTPLINKIFGTNYRTGNLADVPADAVKGYGESIQRGVSEETKAAIKESTPDGDIFKPSTWTLGDKPSVRGYTALGAEVFGQMLPIIAASVATGGSSNAVRMTTTGAAGGTQGGGAAIEQARETINKMAETRIGSADGPTVLERESAYYRDLRQQGFDHKEAVQRTADAAERLAFIYTAPVTSVGGILTGKIINPAEKILSKSNIATRILGRGVLGGLEEGTEEVVEKVQTNRGINDATGTNVDVTEGTFGDFVLGAIGGGGTGTVGGALSSRDKGDAPQPEPTETTVDENGQEIIVSRSGNVEVRYPAPSQAPGPLTRAAENATAPVQESRVTVVAPEGQITGFMESYQEDAEGNYVARVIGDDGQSYTFNSADGVTITPEAGPLTSAIDQVAENDPQPVEETVEEPVAGTEPVVEPAVETQEAPTAQDDQTGFKAAFDSLKDGGVSENLYLQAYDALQNGKDTIAGIKDPILQRAKEAFDAGLITSAADIKTFETDGYPTVTPAVADMSDAQLRERMKYIADQAKANGGMNKMLTAARKEVEREINSRAKQGAQDEQTNNAADLPIRDVGATGDQDATPAKRRGQEAVAPAEVPVGTQSAGAESAGAADGAGVPGADATANKQPALKANKAALDRIAKGTAYFGTTDKAQAFIDKNGLGDTHTVEQTGKVRFEVKPKEQANGNDQRTDQQPDGAEEVRGQEGKAKNTRSKTQKVTESDNGVETTEAVEAEAEGSEAPAAEIGSGSLDDRLDAMSDERDRLRNEIGTNNVGDDTPLIKALSVVTATSLDYNGLADAARWASENNRPDIARAAIERAERGAKRSAEQKPGVSPKSPKYAAILDALSKIAAEAQKGAELVREAAGQTDAPAANVGATNADILKAAQDSGKLEIVNVGDKRPKADPFAGNKIFTTDKVEAARARMKSKFGNLNSGIDPEMMIDGMTVAGAYIESGVREFSAYAKALVADFGDGVKPYLLSFYEGARNYPGLKTEGMSSVDEAKILHAEMLKPADVQSEAVGELVKKPAKRTKKTGAKSDMTLTQDWGVDAINGYSDDFNRETGNTVKDAFLKEARGYLTTVAAVLAEQGYTPHTDAKGRPEKSVSVNESGVAGSGEVNLTLSGPDGVGVYAQISETSLRGVVPTTQTGIAILFRTATDKDKYGSGVAGSRNQWMPVDLSAADLAAMMDKAVKAAVPKDDKAPTITDQEKPNDTEPSGQDAGNSPEGRAAEGVRADAGGQDVGGLPQQTGRADPGTEGRSASRTGQRPTVPEDRGSNAQGAGSQQPAESGRGSRTPASDRGSPKPGSLNYRVKPGELKREGSWRQTAERNVEIVELIKRIDAEGRPATEAERATMVKFTGWGASEIANGVFPDRFGRFKDNFWQGLGERLKAAMTPEEYDQAKRTTQYAHYTSEGVIRSIYTGLDRLGFKGGTVMEPGMGTGLFNGLMPDGMAANTSYTGIEYDTLTGKIAQALYPQSNVIIGDFARTNLPKNFFDAAIGNPPFSQTQVLNDPEYKSKRPMLHDYFFMKTIDRVKPGGIVVFVTSKGTMDKTSDKSRKYLADRANLLGAIRLPQTAFKDNAGTEVVTDVIFLQKRGEGIPENGVNWLGTTEIQTPQGPAAINEYFAANPAMVLGSHALTGSMYRANEYTVIPQEGVDIETSFAKAIENLPENISRPAQGSTAERALVQDRDFNPKHKKEGGLYLSDKGKLMQVEDGSGVELNFRTGSEGKRIALAPKQKKWLRDYVGVRDALKQTQYDQLNDGDWEKSLKALNKAYDAFVKEHGRILDYTTIERTDEDGNTTETKRFKNAALFSTDVEGALAYALESIKEDGSIEKGVALKERVLEKTREPEIKTTQDALFVSLNRLGTLDVDEVAKLAGTDRASVITDLGTSIYEAPGADWQLADDYLSGNVVRKLREAEAAAEINPKYKRNVDALLAVQPQPLGPTDITVRLGANWVPPSDIAQFASEVLGDRMDVTYNPVLGSWSVDARTSSVSEWGFGRMSAGDILGAVLNSRQIKLTTKDSEGKTYPDVESTEKANDIAAKMRERFRTWVWTDATRADRLVKYYNENFNNIAPRKFDGSHLTLPGVSSRFKLYPHQKRAVWRVVQQGDTYLAHAVGAGKTMEMIAAGMEERRLGLVQKPMYVVPNHMLAQFSREFLELYPAANIMVADEQNFGASNRKRFVAQAALNNPDAIVITHSAFGRIGMSEEFSAKFINDQIDTWKSALEDVDKGDRITTKQIERRIEQLERRLEGKQSKERKDNVLTFEELGVDRLYVDEFHKFRKLDFATNQGTVKGITPDGSQGSLDLMMKVQYLRDKKPGRSLVAASGTPVTNTMGELFTAQRFFQPEQLKEDGTDSFDAWSAQYGDIVTGFEQNAAGGYEMVARFAKFQNVPELMRRVRSFMDILTSSNLGELVIRPDVIGGGRKIKVTPVPDGYKEYQQELQRRIQAIRNRRGPPKKGDDIILKVITDGRFSAIDLRFVDPSRPSDPNSKLNIWIDDIITAYKKTANNVYMNKSSGKPDPIKGASILGFSNIGLGEASATNRGFDMKAWIVTRLKEAGIPADHVAFMRDFKESAKKERLFADMREGKKRILIGGEEMETGTNVQKRLTHLFHLDAPWYPASVEQREGRIIRQGNQNKEVDVDAYATKGSYDSTMWGMNARKARFIEQAMNGDDSVRSLDDVSEASAFEMAAALASGDERYLKLAGLKTDVDRLERLRHAHYQEQNTLRRDKHAAEDLVKNSEKRSKEYSAAIAKRTPIKAGEFAGKVGKTTYDNREEFSQALFDAAKKLGTQMYVGEEKLGEVGGFDITYFGMDLKGGNYGGSLHVDVPGDPEPLMIYPVDPAMSIAGMATRAANQVNGLDREVERAQTRMEEGKRRAEQIGKRLGAAFPEEAILMEKVAELNALEAELAAEGEAAKADAAAATQEIEGKTDETSDDGEGEVRYSVAAGETQAEFGPVYTGMDANDAIARLMNEQTGEAIVPRAGLGDVSLVYGDSSAGLAHIAARRGSDIMARLPELLQKGNIYTKKGQTGRVFIGNDRDEAALRLDWNGAAKTWLVSAYEKYPDLGKAGDVRESRRANVVAERTQEGLDKAGLRKALNKGVIGSVITAMADAGVLVLHDTGKTLPKGVRNVRGVQAATMPDGSIHMVASTLTPQNAQAVLFHEAFHKGAERLIGGAEWGKLMGRMGSLYRQSEQSTGKAREFFDKARARVAAAKKQGAVSTRMEVEEFAAYAIEEYESAPAAIRKWVDDLIGLVKAWMVKRFGKQLGQVTPAQLSALAKMAVMDMAADRRGDMFGPLGTLFSALSGAPMQPFYSALQRGIEDISTKSAPAAGWKDAIKGLVNKGIAKQDEVEWSGINDWLDMQTGKVTREQVLDYMAGNGVRVEEVIVGQGVAAIADKYGYEVEMDQYEDGIQFYKDDDYVEFNDLPEEMQAELDKVKEVAKYEKYTLPGGENYREVLLTLPEKNAQKISGTIKFKNDDDTDNFLMAVDSAGLSNLDYGRVDGKTAVEFNNLGSTDFAKFEELARDTYGTVRSNNTGGNRSTYRSAHWDQPNVIAHIRVNDRTDADGKKVLFVEEIQSDWGQQGKKRGFGYKDKTPLTKAEDDELMALYDLSDRRTPEQTARMNLLNDRLNASQGKAGIPAAPFVTKTEGWLNLALKRVMTMAVDGGYDAVAFVNGDQSAERFDLSKQISRLSWVAADIGGYTLSVADVNQKLTTYRVDDEIELAETVGKEISDKIIADVNKGATQGKMEGLDLKVGGEGMKVFYNKIVPNAVNALLKKNGGGKIEPVSVNAPDRRPMGGGAVMMLDEDRRMDQPGFAITDALRQKAAGGMPMFSVQNKGGLDVTPEQGDKAIDAADEALTKAPIKDDYIGRVVGDVGLSARLLVHPRQIAAIHPEFTPVYRTAISQMETRDTHIAELGRDVAAYDGLTQEGKANVNKALELGRLMSIAYSKNDLIEGVVNTGERTVVSIIDGKPVRAKVPVTALLSGAGEVIQLNEQEASAYADLRKMFDRALDMMRGQTLTEMGFGGFVPMDGTKPLMIFEGEDGKIVLKGTVYTDEEKAALREAEGNREEIAKILENNPISVIIRKFEGAGWNSEQFGYEFDARQRPALEKELGDYLKKSAAAQILALIDDKTPAETAERLKNVATFVAEIEQAKRSGYVPFARYGDYVVTVKEKVAEIKYVEDDKEHLIAKGLPDSFADSMLDMGAEQTPEGWRIKKSQKQDVERLTEKTVYSAKVETGINDFMAERKATNVEQIPAVKEAIEKARKEYVAGNPNRRIVAFKAKAKKPNEAVKLSDVDALAEVASIDNQTWDLVRDALADAIKSQGFRRHFFHADNVPGYTGDFERSIADYVIGMSGYLSRRQHMKQWDRSVSSITAKPKLFEYASQYRDYVNNPQEELAMVRQIGFFSYIAGVAASAFANLTQVPFLTVPTLSQVAPFALVMKETARAYKDAALMMGRPSRVGLDMFDPNKAPADVRKSIKSAWDEGVFVPLESFDLMMTARQRNVGRRKLVKGFNTATQAVAIAFTFAERMNRLVTFIAAHRIAEKRAVQINANKVLAGNALAKSEILGSNWNSRNFSEWAVDESQFRMGKANRPTTMRGVGSAIMQFKGFMLQTFEAWYRMAALHGKEGKFAAAASIMVLFATAGLWGMPGADDLRKLLEALYKQITDKDLDMKTELRAWIARTSGSNALAQIVNKGVTYPTGLDLTRVGLGSIVPDSPLAAAGIPFDMLIGRPKRAIEKISAGDEIGGAAELTPNFIKHWLVAGAWAFDGVRDKRGNLILSKDDLSGSDIAMKAFGFQPSIVSDVRDYEYAQRRAETAVDGLKRSYTAKLARAIASMEGETDEAKLRKIDQQINDIYADIDKHNEKADPEQIIKIGNTALRNRIMRELDGVKSTWGRERKNARGSANELRGIFGLSEDDE